MKNISRKKKKRSKFYNIRVPKRDPIVLQDITYIPLTRGLFAMIDTEDLDKVCSSTWFASIHSRGKPYAMARISKQRIYLHRLIMGASPGDGRNIDHLSGFTLDNRKVNLRFCSRGENIRNSKPRSNTGYKGVSKTRNGKYAAYYDYNCKHFHIGTFDTPIPAAIARDEAVTKIDSLTFLNFPKTHQIVDLKPNCLLVN